MPLSKLLTLPAYSIPQKPSAFMRSLSRFGKNTNRSGFSLVEVVIALGVMSFALLPLVALLPVGLRTAQDSMDTTVIASISQQVRGHLQQIPFTSGAGSINDLASTSQDLYFTMEGVKTTSGSLTSPAYYKATFSVNDSAAPGASFDQNNARTITVKLYYPLATNPTKPKKVFSLFVARQPGVLE